MVKKEVIYFDGVAYGPFANCELTNGYLESFYMNMDEEDSGGGKKIKLDESKILYFWKKIDELKVWNWKKSYHHSLNEPQPPPDGYTWVVKLRNRDGKSKYSTGYEKFPKTFKKFVDELNKLFETKIDYWD